MAFRLEGRLDQVPPGLLPPVHASGGLGDQRSTLVMFVENQKEIVRPVDIFPAELVQPLDRLHDHHAVEPIRIVPARWVGLLDPDVEDKPANALDLVEEAVGERPEFPVAPYVRHRVEAGTLLLPNGRMLPRPLYLECEKLRLSLEELGPKPAHLGCW